MNPRPGRLCLGLRLGHNRPGIQARLKPWIGAKDYPAVMHYFRLLSLLAVPLLLAGCETMDSLVPSMPDFMGGSSSASQPASTTGLAVSDEPYAAQTGATILSQGGSAADGVS